MADLKAKTLPGEGAAEDKPDNKVNAASNTEKRETLEDLLTTLGQQINNSDWLQQNTAEKFAEENPEVAKAFKDVTLKNSQDGGVAGDS